MNYYLWTMKNIISGPVAPVQDTIILPSSKSISNRMLLIHALGKPSGSFENLSESDDTRVMKEALAASGKLKNVGHAGTAMRFLTAYYATVPGEWVLTGSERMKQRPIGPLVDALRNLGAKVRYLENDGYPPLRISGGALHGGPVIIDGGVSSQFISALMMVGPVLRGGLQMEMTGRPVSSTYLEMTAGLMKSCGVPVTMDGRFIRVPSVPYRTGHFRVESDWSAASYWFQAAALLPGSTIRLPRLFKESLQGDSVLVSLFAPLGVSASFTPDGLKISSAGRDRPATLPKEPDPKQFTYDFEGCPDLVQTLAVTLCALGIPFRFSGTRTLRIKETDRIDALQAELKKLGFLLVSDSEGDLLSWDGSRVRAEHHPVISTYHDHRMALAFASASAVFGRLYMEDPGVVSKSYPGFWEDLRRAGYSISSSGHDDEGRTVS